MGLQTEKNFFGLDISDRSLRLINLRKRGKKFTIVSFNELNFPPEILVDGQIQDMNKMANYIKKVIKTTKGSKISSKNLVSVLPETKTFIKVIDVDLGDYPEIKNDVTEVIKKEIVKHVPLNVDEIYLDWQTLIEEGEKMRILVGAVPRDISDSFVQTIEKAGYSPQILEIEAAPIIRSLIPEKDKKPKIIIDFGANRTGLIVYDNEAVQFTVSLGISGEKITKTIAKNLNLDEKKSEKAKLVCGLDKDKCEGALRKVLFDSINKLAKNIQKSINYYQENFPQSNKIEEVVLCGGGANFLKIDEVLQEKLKLPVRIGDPLINNVINKKSTIPASKLLSYTTAIGLALRNFEKK